MLHKLTKSFVDKVTFEKSGQVFYRDSELLGFGLRVGKTAKVYIAEAKLHGKTVRKSIARHNLEWCWALNCHVLQYSFLALRLR